ncbi:MAG: pyruvate kinase [Leptospiraceae bacterium]|nr:pyruvate kinase [Leptospiraceae bacterium]MDW8307070.1 pyruvate kinase [Leptospiraceae bacterium]
MKRISKVSYVFDDYAMQGFLKTKIIATLGPASAQEETIRAMIQAGASGFRINFSHGNAQSLQPLIETARRAILAENKPVPLLADIQGPKLRIGKLPKEGVTLVENQIFIITGRKVEGSAMEVHSPYEYLARDVRPGTRILLADGTLELVVEEVRGGDVYTRVVVGGRLYSNKGMNIPNTRLSVETLTEKDKADLAFVGTGDIDLAAISFVRSANDIRLARKYLKNDKKPVLAKLEVSEALENLNEIIEEADGILIARGDLGVELPFEKVPILQKQILEKAAVRGKWAMVATQMLGSMVLNSRPSRAEVSDVANAVLDGADALMLSEETAIGDHPVKAVEAMARIIREMETLPNLTRWHFAEDITSFAAGSAGAAVSAAERMKAKAIVTLAGSGLATLLLSKWRPKCPILALNSDAGVLRRMNILHGTIPLAIKPNCDTETQIHHAATYVSQYLHGEPGDILVVVGSSSRKKNPDLIRLVRI